jgi:undecaprenyl-phosphate 4-deoxy-4-formamido-L-arabinose transferase
VTLAREENDMQLFQPSGPTSAPPPRPESRPLHRLSIVVPVYQGEQTLNSLVVEIEPLTQPQHTAAGNLFQISELIFVHDGAIDRSDLVLESLAEQYPFIRVVWLSRNFGQHPATLAGLACTTGEWVVTIDEDGQQNPQDIGKLLDLALETGVQLVYARPVNTPPHGRVRNAMSSMAKWLFIHALGHAAMGRFNSFRLIQGEIARSLGAYCGPNVYLDVALSWMVARSLPCDVVLRHGADRPSGYNFVKLLKHFLRLLLTSGTRPLRLISLMGFACIAVSVIISTLAIWHKITHQTRVPGWTSLIIAICFFSGCILSALGVIAEYLGAMLTMTMGRPLYVVVPRPSRRRAA